MLLSLRWRHNGRDSASNHQPHECLLNRLIRRRSKKTSNSTSLAFVWVIHRGPVNSPHKWPVTRKCFHLMTPSCSFTSPGDDALDLLTFSSYKKPQELLKWITNLSDRYTHKAVTCKGNNIHRCFVRYMLLNSLRTFPCVTWWECFRIPVSLPCFCRPSVNKKLT